MVLNISTQIEKKSVYSRSLETVRLCERWSEYQGSMIAVIKHAGSSRWTQGVKRLSGHSRHRTSARLIRAGHLQHTLSSASYSTI